MFGTPQLVLFDSLRVIAAVSALIVIGATPYALIRRHMNWHQRVRFVGSALVGAAIIGAYLQTLGEIPPAWWRLVLVTVGITLSLVGLVAYLRETRHGR